MGQKKVIHFWGKLMKKSLFVMLLILIMPTLSGCATDENVFSDLSMVYCITAFLSLFPLLSCFFLEQKAKKWFIFLFSSVFVVNAGYTLLSVSPSLEVALWANRISYLGSVYLPFAMTMIILNVVNADYKKWLPVVLFLLSTAVLFVTASPGYSDIYYKEVSFEIINGTSKLVKVYGAFHSLYLFYLVGYFVSMVAIIVYARLKKNVEYTSHAVILAIAVFVNIGVWLIEQFTRFDFEFLSVSYIISELFLLGAHLITVETQKLAGLVRQNEETETNYAPTVFASNNMKEAQVGVLAKESSYVKTVSEEALETFNLGLKRLTPTERAIYELYICGKTTKDIMNELGIKENTLKFHNKNIYSKLGVTSRKQLFEIYESIK